MVEGRECTDTEATRMFRWITRTCWLGEGRIILKAILPEMPICGFSGHVQAPQAQESRNYLTVACQAKGFIEMVPVGSQWLGSQNQLRGVEMKIPKQSSRDPSTGKWPRVVSRLFRWKHMSPAFWSMSDRDVYGGEGRVRSWYLECS